MLTRAWIHRCARLVAVLWPIAFAVNACAATDGLAPSVMPGASATIPPSVQPTDSEVPSPSTTPITLPSSVVRLGDPPIEVTLPEGWREVPVPELLELVQSLDRDAPGNARYIDLVTGDKLVTTAEGYTRDAVYVQLEISIERGTTSLQDVIPRVSDDIARIGVVDTVETGTLDAPVGRVTWIRALLKLLNPTSTARPANVMVYLVPLEGTGTLVLQSIGVQSDESHRQMLARMLSTLRFHDGTVVPDAPVARHGTITNPDVGFVYPDRFVPVPIPSYRDYLTSIVDHPTADRAEVVRLMDEIDSGVLRARMTSIRPLGIGEYIDVKVEHGDFNREVAIERIKRKLGDPTIEDEEELELAMGRAIAFSFSTEKQGLVNGEQISITLANDIVVVSVPDGRTMTIAGLAPQSDPGFGDVVSALAASME